MRGRLVAGVTVVVAGSVERPIGLTASSVTMVDGDPWRILVVISETSDVYDTIADTGGFVVSVLTGEDTVTADRLAGLVPAPGGMFQGLDLTATEWGPRLESLGTWAGCRLESLQPLGYQHLMVASVDHVEVDDLVDPLLYYRGRYRRLES